MNFFLHILFTLKSKENIPRSMSAVALHMVGKARTSRGWRREEATAIYRLVMRSNTPTEKQMATCKFSEKRLFKKNNSYKMHFV